MVFVTVGTQDKPFKRLLDLVQKAIDEKIIDDVIIQAGCTLYKSDNMKIYDLLSQDEYEEYIKKCDLLITHGGVGSILTGLKNNKKVIVCPRISKYKEHINDHQVQIVDNFYSSGYILKYCEGDNLKEILKQVKKFKPKKYISNTDNFIKIIEKFINEN